MGCGTSRFELHRIQPLWVLRRQGSCYHQAVENRTEPRTIGQWIHYIVIVAIALLLVWMMLRVYVL